ncbi:MAG: hypothetical protein RLZZ385_1102 [Pseudomonadota bacterium]
MRNIKGHVAIITGSSSGVGAATAKLLASLGCHVVINYSRSADAAQKVADECRQQGVEALVCQADVADDGQCRKLVQQAIDQWGRLDFLVNNAGTTKFCDHDKLDGLTAEDFHHIYGINVIGAYQMVRAARPFLEAAVSGGAVVNVASTAAITGIGSSIAYAASKGAMVTMTLSLARVLGPNVRVNAVCPGFIQGEWLLRGFGEEKYNAFMKQSMEAAPLKVTATAETVADAILQFITGCQIITGETLIVDGGRHLNQVPMTRR